MNGSGSLLTQEIDRALQTLPPATGDLFSAVREYLSLPVPAHTRAAAMRVAEMAKSGPQELSEEHFRSALISLRDALDSQREQEIAADQFANEPELVQEFLVEAREHLTGVEAQILLLERDPENAESLNSVFRSFHTIKGLAGFLGAMAIQELAHETENVLDLARAGKILLCPEIADLILRAADELNRCLDKGGTQKLNSLPRCDPKLLDALGAISHQPRAPVAQRKYDGVATSALSAPAGHGRVIESSVVRVETAKLEYLIDMVGELVIAESVVRHDPAVAAVQDPLLSRNLTQLARVVQEVQKTSMSMRMVAVGSLFRRMSRVTRDLARKSGKTLDLVLIGEDVELDRSIVEDLADPMIHMVRNAVDHGLETPSERAAAGKPARCSIRLQAMHDAGDIVIEVADDGRGMNPARILARAKSLGIVGEDETPDEEAIFRLILEPGFSTAEKVTDFSGRGVGMDVVRKKIQKLRGRISIRSGMGKGSTFTLRLPLTLAIIDGLVVGVGSHRYILPMFAVREMFSPRPETFITLENRAEAAFFRDKLLPLVRLSRLFETREEDRTGGVLIVVEGRDQLYCVAVDELIGKQEVVIKSLGKTFRDVPAISGGAILGDGRVGLIIDVNSLRD